MNPGAPDGRHDLGGNSVDQSGDAVADSAQDLAGNDAVDLEMESQPKQLACQVPRRTPEAVIARIEAMQ